MKNISRHIGVVESVTRMPSSSNANPRFRVYVAGVSCCTTPDSSYGYMIQNLLGKKVEVLVGTHYGICQIDSIREID